MEVLYLIGMGGTDSFVCNYYEAKNISVIMIIDLTVSVLKTANVSKHCENIARNISARVIFGSIDRICLFKS